jgi:hypothetical protein
MKSTTKHLLSGCVLIVFALFALSSRVNRIHLGAFSYSNRVEDSSDTRNYLMLNDGTKIYGGKVGWKSGMLVKDQIKIDDQKYKISEVKGYQDKQVFYVRLKNIYIQRIVHGKINVYVDFTNVTTTSVGPNGFIQTHTYVRTDHYSQQGEDGPLVVFANQTDIENLVSGCPLSVEMVHKSDRQLRKAIRHDRNYMNNIFNVYNNGCKPVTGGQ